MIRKYLNHKLQTNPQHREDEPHNNHETSRRQKRKATSPLLPIKTTAEAEWTQSNTKTHHVVTITNFCCKI